MAFERPSPGNPHQLTVNQHIFPARSIERFYGDGKMVQVFNKQTGETFPSKSRNPIFCAQRAWDHWSERGFMREIENRFQPIADDICSGKLRSITQLEHDAISRMFALWSCRFQNQDNSQPDPVFDWSKPAVEFDQVALEDLEREGIFVQRPDRSFPMRHLIGMRMSSQVEDWTYQMAMSRGNWGILRAQDGEFLVPDNFGQFQILPLSPKILLAYRNNDRIANLAEVVELNQIACACASRYIFARDWAEVSLTF